MRLRQFLAAAIFASVPGVAHAGAAISGPWSVTLYAGPATNSFFTRILSHGFQSDSTMVGLAVDSRLFRLGGGFSVIGEGQITQYAFGQSYTTGALGLGVRYDFLAARDFPMSLSLTTGPSYAIHPPMGFQFHRKALLNYVGAELTFPIPHSRGWDVALRIYHRSGVWGLYSQDADEGSMIGIGIRKRF